MDANDSVELAAVGVIVLADLRAVGWYHSPDRSRRASSLATRPSSIGSSCASWCSRWSPATARARLPSRASGAAAGSFSSSSSRSSSATPTTTDRLRRPRRPHASLPPKQLAREIASQMALNPERDITAAGAGRQVEPRAADLDQRAGRRRRPDVLAVIDSIDDARPTRDTMDLIGWPPGR